MKVEIIPVLEDNYSYIVFDQETKEDPSDADKVIRRSNELGIKVRMVLTTHHHWDHASGNSSIKNDLPDVEIIGGDSRVDCLDRLVVHEETLQLSNMNIRALHTPCHTSGSFCYLIEDKTNEQQKALFTGDTMFIAGCGKFFEGDASQMYHSLYEVLMRLPEEVLVYPGHEYTFANLKFALLVDPNNAAVKTKLVWADKQRELLLPTAPSTIHEELDTNPFLRVASEPIVLLTNTKDPILGLKILREMKDSFRAS